MNAPSTTKNPGREIQVVQGRSNNLSAVDLVIPHGQWVSFCGVSGSGKSSLAFDTLYAEGQRRYVQCLSPKTRQFVQHLEKPDADAILGVPPSIAIRPAVSSWSTETVASATEIEHLLSELFAQCSIAVCPQCQQPTLPQTKSAMVDQINHWPSGTKVQICYRVGGAGDAPGEVAMQLTQAMKSGFVRAIVGSGSRDQVGPRTCEIATLDLSDRCGHSGGAEDGVLVVVDRVTAGNTDAERIVESLELAMHFGNSAAIVLAGAESFDHHQAASQVWVDQKRWAQVVFTRSLVCANCEHQFAKPDQRLFQRLPSTQSCGQCGGKGSLETGCCDRCGGSGLNDRVNEFQFSGLTIRQWGRLTVDQATAAIAGQPTAAAAKKVVDAIVGRLSFLSDSGLGYLQLSRVVSTLSSGERQRVKLASILGSTLVNMLYVLDEPAMGLHPVEVQRLNQCISLLHRKNNTVVVVDHNAEVIMAAQRVIELGPGAGAEGGEIVFDGSPQQLVVPNSSLTGEYVANRRGLSCRSDQRRKQRGRIGVTGAVKNNLKDVTVDFPLGGLCVVTGVSGSGKSSLLIDTLYPALVARKKSAESIGSAAEADLTHVVGDDGVDEVVMIDGLPIGRTGRSNPVTYVKAFDDIRKAFAETVDAKAHGITAGQFSFNVAGGRCEKCNGEGVQTFDMQFLADIHVKCDQCLGTRYRPEVLNVRYRDKNISEVLGLTVREAFLFFRGQPKVQNRLKALIDVGLEYVPLGQPATTLSSGEAQRLKLASYLNASKNKRVLFMMDEPTTGLHMEDVTRMLDCFDSLITAGHSLIVIEHNLQLIKNADFVIDLGPGAGDRGGEVVVAGTPEVVAACGQSVTGRFLKTALERAGCQ